MRQMRESEPKRAARKGVRRLDCGMKQHCWDEIVGCM